MNRKIYSLTLLLLACFLAPASLLAGEYDGTWVATVTKSSSTCKSIGRALEGDYTASIRQDEGSTITLTVQETGTIFQGIRMQADPRIIQLQASFLREAGIVSQKINIKMTDENSGTGNANWDWSDGLMICGGNYTFTLKRKK